MRYDSKKGGCAPPSPAPIFFLFVAMQIERILDKKEKHATKRNESSETTFPNLPAANETFASILLFNIEAVAFIKYSRNFEKL